MSRRLLVTLLALVILAPMGAEAQPAALLRPGAPIDRVLVISLDGASRVQEGDEAEIWVDGSKIHLFDPATGENLTVDSSSAGTIPADTSTAQVAQEQDAIASPGEQEAQAQE